VLNGRGATTTTTRILRFSSPFGLFVDSRRSSPYGVHICEE
ncbi:hypothetical protein A2U01_0075391, partial [Trifolium medium]|nr:hypothetical protein [Trifolium medium]